MEYKQKKKRDLRSKYILFDLCRYFYILVYLRISSLNIFICNKPVFISHHAVLRAELREIAFPDQVTRCICTGKIFRFGKNHIRFVKQTRKGCIICIGIENVDAIIIKTIERGN